MNVYHVREFEWFKGFQDDREDVGDNVHPGGPSTSKTDENIEKVGNLVRSNHRLTICLIAETVGIGQVCVKQIFHNNLNMCAKIMPKIPIIAQKDARKMCVY